MKTRRLLALIFNMVASGMALLTYALIGLLFLAAALSYRNASGALGGFALLTFAIFAACVILIIMNIVHFVRHTKNQYNSFDKYAIALGVMNGLSYIVITILYVLGISNDSIATQYTAFSIASGYMVIGMSFLMSIAAVVVSIISLHKEAARFPNA